MCGMADGFAHASGFASLVLFMAGAASERMFDASRPLKTASLSADRVIHAPNLLPRTYGLSLGYDF